MPNTTKAALEESLKRLLLKKPLDKITITDITTDCGISRMAFYYHFKDIYDLVEWSCLEDARIALQGKKTSSTWHEGLLQIFDAGMENNKKSALGIPFGDVGNPKIVLPARKFMVSLKTKSEHPRAVHAFRSQV